MLDGAPVLIQALLQGKYLWLLVGPNQVDQGGEVIPGVYHQLGDPVRRLDPLGIAERTLLDEGALVYIGLDIGDRVIRQLVELACSFRTFADPGSLA